MARYTGPATRKSRRLGVDLVGGDQAFEKRPYPPGQHGRARIKESEYRQQLQEKQKARFSYGVMEKQFRRYYEEANRLPGKTGDNLLTILESRLDNVIYRAGLARPRRAAPPLGPPRPFRAHRNARPGPAGGPSARPPRPLRGQRQARRRPVVPRRAVRHRHGAQAVRRDVPVR